MGQCPALDPELPKGRDTLRPLLVPHLRREPVTHGDKGQGREQDKPVAEAPPGGLAIPG